MVVRAAGAPQNGSSCSASEKVAAGTCDVPTTSSAPDAIAPRSSPVTGSLPTRSSLSRALVQTV